MWYLGGWTLAAGAVAATIFQFVGALTVRGYARFLYTFEEQELDDIVLDITHAESGSAKFQHEKSDVKKTNMPPKYS